MFGSKQHLSDSAVQPPIPEKVDDLLAKGFLFEDPNRILEVVFFSYTKLRRSDV